jgi:hypothetical protein
MKRREFVQTIPAAALLTTGTGIPSLVVADSHAAEGKKTKGFKVDDSSFDDPGAYDKSMHCDQFGIDADGNPISDSLTGTGSDAGLKEHDPANPFKMKLTQEEQDILNGSQGPVMAKVLKTIVAHGELFGAERLADCGGAPHSSLYTGSPWVEPVLEMFEEIADAGLKAHAPYTVNPMPVDLYSVGQDPVKRNMMLDGYPLQGRLIQVHTRLGARPLDNWSCACYLPEVGNTAEPGTVVSWAESSAVNYGNSVLGMRINRMATGMEVLCAIAGKVPVFGVLTAEGRKAKWHIDVRLSKEPHWGALGGAVGTKVVEQIPYVTGIDQWLTLKEDGGVDGVTMGKLKAFGSATASSGAVTESFRFCYRIERRCRPVSRGEHYTRSDRARTWSAGRGLPDLRDRRRRICACSCHVRKPMAGAGRRPDSGLHRLPAQHLRRDRLLEQEDRQGH